MLVEEFLRAGIPVDFSDRHFIDVQTIYHKLERRTLEAAYRFYCNKTLENAHSAEADTLATFEVLEAQIERYPEELQNDVAQLAEFSSYGKRVDFAGSLIYNEAGEIVINFGKHKGQSALDILSKDSGYYRWVMDAQFPLETKLWFSRLYQQTRTK